MGMIATVINAVAIKEVLLKVNVNTVVYSLLDVPAVAKKYNIANVKKDLSLNKVIILGGGTGKPFFTTDTGATKVAKELGIKLIVVGKDGTDGVYSDDPKINKKAIRYSHLSISDAIKQNLKFMDLSAMKMCKAEKINLLIFNIQRKKAIVNAIKHKIPTTIIEAK
jgi:uridylate kinase